MQDWLRASRLSQKAAFRTVRLPAGRELQPSAIPFTSNGLGGGLGAFVVGQFVKLHGGHFQVNVDAIQKRPRDSGAVPVDERRPALAVVGGIPKVAAGTRIHGACQHEPQLRIIEQNGCPCSAYWRLALRGAAKRCPLGAVRSSTMRLRHVIY